MTKKFSTKKYLKEWEGICTFSAVVTDERGYLAITGEVIPPRCKTPQACGCCHDKIAEAFPMLRKLLPFHLADLKSGFSSYAIENSCHCLLNGERDVAQSLLHATDAEMQELEALCTYGLCVTRWCNSFNQITGQSKEVYANTIHKMGIPQRVEKEMAELMQYIATL